MKEYKIICDRYEKSSKKYGGKEVIKKGVAPIAFGATEYSIYTDYNRVVKKMEEIIIDQKTAEAENNARFDKDHINTYHIYRIQSNYRIVSREVTEWVE